jgi:lysyl-tRNA synthetase class 2
MSDLAKDRLDKLRALESKGVEPYPARVPAPEPIAQCLAALDARTGTRATVAGRLTQVRDFGKLRFAHLVDRSGAIQIGFQQARLAAFWPDRKAIEAGDLVVIRGEIGRTQKGEPTIWADEVVLASKALQPPPEKWHGLVDVEARYRMRYVDLSANGEVRDLFQKRSRIVHEVRSYFVGLGYLEVETPILQPIFGGATARPFVTHHNALDMELYLRIAPELYLKRLLVGGLERVFEIGRVFRNEGLSTRHNPEFTMLESYEAWADYRDVMARVEGLFAHLCERVLGRTEIEFRGRRFDLRPPFRRARYADLFAQANGGLDFFDFAGVRRRAQELELTIAGVPPEKLANDVFEATVEDTLDGPVFVYDYPAVICPFAKNGPADPRFAERFELFVAGMEIANAFSELNDPIEQRARLLAQLEHHDEESPSVLDEDYVRALEYGMPPAGGLGIGIDRLVMVLTDSSSIRDVVLFPLLRPVADIAAEGAPTAPAAEEGT